MADESKRVIYSAIAANVAIGIAKFIAGAVTGSSAMISEGIHSIVDTADGGFLLIGRRLGAKPPDEAHPYGHGRELYFWSFMVAIFIFAAGGGVSVMEGVRRLLHPEPIRAPLWNYIVLAVSFVLEGTSFFIASRHFLRIKPDDIPVLQAIRRSKNPSDFMVLFEDGAALVGLIVATIGVSLELWTGMTLFDGAASIVIGLVLAAVATLLAIETRSLLLGEGILRTMASEICTIVDSDDTVLRTTQPFGTYFGPDTVLLNLAIKFRDDLAVGQVEEAIERIEKKIRERYPVVKRVFIAADPPEAPAEDVARSRRQQSR